LAKYATFVPIILYRLKTIW